MNLQNDLNFFDSVKSDRVFQHSRSYICKLIIVVNLSEITWKKLNIFLYWIEIVIYLLKA